MYCGDGSAYYIILKHSQLVVVHSFSSNIFFLLLFVAIFDKNHLSSNKAQKIAVLPEWSRY